MFVCVFFLIHLLCKPQVNNKMKNQLDQINEAENAKNQAIFNVAMNGGEPFLKALSFSVEWVKNRVEEFSTEEIKADFFALNPDVVIREPRVWGSVITFLKKNGLCVSTGRYKISNQKICHRGHKALWMPTVKSKTLPKQPSFSTQSTNGQQKLF